MNININTTLECGTNRQAKMYANNVKCLIKDIRNIDGEPKYLVEYYSEFGRMYGLAIENEIIRFGKLRLLKAVPIISEHMEQIAIEYLGFS